MNKSIIGLLNLLVMKTEIRQIGPYFHPTMIICKVFLLITKTVQNHTKLEHTTRLKGRDRDRQGGRDLRGGGLLHELEEVGGGPHRLCYLLCHRRFSSASSSAGRRSHPRRAGSSADPLRPPTAEGGSPRDEEAPEPLSPLFLAPLLLCQRRRPPPAPPSRRRHPLP